MRFLCSRNWAISSTYTVGENRIAVTHENWWKSLFRDKLLWRWPNGANCELFIPNINPGTDHNWYIHVDGVQVCTGALKGSFPDWGYHRVWQCADWQILQGRLPGNCQLMCVKKADDKSLLGAWRYTCCSTQGVIRDTCDETVKMIVFGIMLAESSVD